MAEVDIEPGFISLIFEPTPPVEMLERAKQFNVQMNGRRTTRHFSSQAPALYAHCQLPLGEIFAT